MSIFRTPVVIHRSPFTVSFRNPVFTIGSCFSDMLGNKLSANKFPVSVNPFGVSYNPVSIHKLLHYTIQNALPAPHTYVLHNEIFSNYDFHSSFSSLRQTDIEDNIKNAINFNHSFLLKSNFLIITYGTAWVYERTDTQEVVANCHKIESGNFKKHLLTPENIVDSFDTLYKELKSFNPDLKIILTVSPVRHIKETLELNSVSKGILRLACHRLTERYDQVEYFPAYEILLDDLRDYRFFAADMIHPSEEAEQYIWSKFSEKYFDDETHQFLSKWKNIQTALQHKPFHPDSLGHQYFLKNLLNSLESLKSTIPVEKEIQFIQDQLNQR